MCESLQQITLCFCFLPKIKDKLDRNSNIELSMTFVMQFFSDFRDNEISRQRKEIISHDDASTCILLIYSR